jgi:glycosyltransferase involved in cell wall biosynthesis
MGAGRPAVLHVAQPIDGGVARYVGDLVRDQAARGWRVALATPSSPDLDELCRAAGVSLERWAATRDPGLSTVREIRSLSRIVRTAQPDVVHLHSSKAGLVGRLTVRGRRPTIFTPHAWSFLHGGRLTRRAALGWERYAARWTDLLVCVSEAERARGEDAAIRGRTVVVPNAVDAVRFSPATDGAKAAARRELGLGAGPVAVCVGRLVEQKGQDLLLDAWRAVRSRVSDAELVLVGDGPLGAELRGRDVPGVGFVGHLADVRPAYAAADVVVASSRWEGLSLVVLEAMASGRAVVATDVDGMREAVGTGPGAAGVIVPAGDVTALAGALGDRLADLALASAEGRQARARAERFDLATWGAALAALTEDVAAG